MCVFFAFSRCFSFFVFCLGRYVSHCFSVFFLFFPLNKVTSYLDLKGLNVDGSIHISIPFLFEPFWKINIYIQLYLIMGAPETSMLKHAPIINVHRHYMKIYGSKKVWSQGPDFLSLNSFLNSFSIWKHLKIRYSTTPRTKYFLGSVPLN